MITIDKWAELVKTAGNAENIGNVKPIEFIEPCWTAEELELIECHADRIKEKGIYAIMHLPYQFYKSKQIHTAIIEYMITK